MGVAARLTQRLLAGPIDPPCLVYSGLAPDLFSVVASKDVIARTVPKTRRGRMNGPWQRLSGWLGNLAFRVYCLIWPPLMPTPCFTPPCLVGTSALLWSAAQPDFDRSDRLKLPGIRGWPNPTSRAAWPWQDHPDAATMRPFALCHYPCLACSAPPCPHPTMCCGAGTEHRTWDARPHFLVAMAWPAALSRAVLGRCGQVEQTVLIRSPFLATCWAGSSGHTLVGPGYPLRCTRGCSRWPSLCWAFALPGVRIGPQDLRS